MHTDQDSRGSHSKSSKHLIKKKSLHHLDVGDIEGQLLTQALQEAPYEDLGNTLDLDKPKQPEHSKAAEKIKVEVQGRNHNLQPPA